MIDRLRGKLTRRELFSIGIRIAPIAAAGFAGFAAGLNCEPKAQPIVQGSGEKVQALDPERLLNPILAETPFTNRRLSMEHQYLSEVLKDPTLQRIDRGFWVISDPSIRAKLLDQRWTLRKEGKEGLEPLPEGKIKWAREQGIHPEILALCDDMYDYTKEKLILPLNKAGRLRDDGIVFKEDNLDEPLINPGGMARLIHYETGDVHHFSKYAFTNIGDGLVVEQLNLAVFPSGLTDLEELCNIVNKQTGLNFTPKNIPGSLWQNPENKRESGGAIPPIQLMPPNALKYYRLIKEVTGIELNPFDLKDAIKIAWIFLARHESVGKDIRGNNLYRIGYRRGVEPDQINSLFKWNEDEDILVVLRIARLYFNKFLDKDAEKVYTH